ncbi:MAG: response regulator [Desulfobacterales bacterium]|nr:response regulator [Desulfobacterales bacterium]
MSDPRKVVIIDDNADYLFTMETFLKRKGFEVFTAEDGEKGLEMVRAQLPDIVLLDIMMETLFAGFEVCRIMRTEPELQNIPIIGVSAAEGMLDFEYSQGPDFKYFSPDDFMEKPVDKERLVKLIHEVIEKAKKQKKQPKWKKEMEKSHGDKVSIS